MPEVRLERPELFRRLVIYPLARYHKHLFLKWGKKAAQDTSYQPNLAVVIRTKNDELGLKRLLEFIERTRQGYQGRIDVVVVDTESADNCVKLAKRFGAEVVNMPQKNFNYARNVNLGLERVKKDVPVAFVVVGHAQPVLNNCIQAGVRHFKDSQVAGAYGPNTVHENASTWEKLTYLNLAQMPRGAYKLKKPIHGAMQCTNCMVRMSDWRKHHFDEAYGHGGEDYEWAEWAIGHGRSVVYEPAMAVHHTHGLRFWHFVRQVRQWRKIVRGPGDFDEQKIAKFRPDLFKK